MRGKHRWSATAVAALLLAVALAGVASAGFGPKLKPNMHSKRVLATQTYSITGSDNPQRFEVSCPKGKRPLGGGAITSPPVDATGAGAIPTAYERLGQQEGWHITISQIHRQGTSNATLQVLCRKYKGNIDPVEHFIKSQTFTNIGAGETKRFTETCPGKKKIVTGGFLTSQLFNAKGVYVAESRMVGNNGWTVLAHGVDSGIGGQVTAIAYCTKSKKTLLKEVAGPPATATLGTPNTPGTTATSTAPDCPGKSKLVAGGFSSPPGVLVFDGSFADLDTWRASAAPFTGSGAVTALGYCL
jgi:hypothetical protein